MDWLSIPQRAGEFLKKYKYVAAVFLLGLLLLTIPDQKVPESTPVITEPARSNDDFSKELEDILSQIQGAGEVRVLLSCSSGPETVYQQKEELPSESQGGTIRREPVVVTDSDRHQSGLVRVELAPRYLGAIVLCQGADSAAIRLAITEAVSNATGLSSNCISVLKMK